MTGRKLLSLLVTLFLASPAGAATTVALLPVASEGGESANLDEELRAAFAAIDGHELLEAELLTSELEAVAAFGLSCVVDDEECLGKLANTLPADMLVVPSLAAGRVLSIDAYASASASKAGEVQTSLPDDPAALAQAVAGLATSLLLPGSAPQPGASGTDVDTNPTGTAPEVGPNAQDVKPDEASSDQPASDPAAHQAAEDPASSSGTDSGIDPGANAGDPPPEADGGLPVLSVSVLGTGLAAIAAGVVITGLAGGLVGVSLLMLRAETPDGNADEITQQRAQARSLGQIGLVGLVPGLVVVGIGLVAAAAGGVLFVVE